MRYSVEYQKQAQSRCTLRPFGRPFVERFALCYRTVVLSVCAVCNVGVLWPNGWMDQYETWHAGRPRPWPYCVRWGRSSPPPKGGEAPNIRPISVVAKWLHGSRSHLLGRSASAKRHCIRWGPSSPSPKRERSPPVFGTCLLWPNGWMDEDAT